MAIASPAASRDVTPGGKFTIAPLITRRPATRAFWPGRRCRRCVFATITKPRGLLLPEVERQQRQGKEVVFRADAAFAKPELYEALEERDVKCAIRLPSNDNLERYVVELLTRPVGRPSYKPVVRYKSFLYQAASWTSPHFSPN